jgi:hypothetical protein
MISAQSVWAREWGMWKEVNRSWGAGRLKAESSKQNRLEAKFNYSVFFLDRFY